MARIVLILAVVFGVFSFLISGSLVLGLVTFAVSLGGPAIMWLMLKSGGN